MKKNTRYTICLVSIIFLSGCSKEPSQEEVYTAIEASLKNEYTELTENKIFGISAANISGITGVTINNIEKINCTPGEKNTATCDVLVDYKFESKEDSLHKIIGVSGQNKNLKRYKFIKTNQGWTHIKEQ